MKPLAKSLLGVGVGYVVCGCTGHNEDFCQSPAQAQKKKKRKKGSGRGGPSACALKLLPLLPARWKEHNSGRQARPDRLLGDTAAANRVKAGAAAASLATMLTAALSTATSPPPLKGPPPQGSAHQSFHQLITGSPKYTKVHMWGFPKPIDEKYKGHLRPS